MAESVCAGVCVKIWDFLPPPKMGKGGKIFLGFCELNQGPHRWHKNDTRPSGQSRVSKKQASKQTHKQNACIRPCFARHKKKKSSSAKQEVLGYNSDTNKHARLRTSLAVWHVPWCLMQMNEIGFALTARLICHVYAKLAALTDAAENTKLSFYVHPRSCDICRATSLRSERHRFGVNKDTLDVSGHLQLATVCVKDYTV